MLFLINVIYINYFDSRLFFGDNIIGGENMKKVFSRVLSTLLVLSILIMVLPQQVNAAETDYLTKNVGGTKVITGYSGSDTVLSIPATLGGIPVSAIDIDAFKGKTGLVSVTIPDCITNIGNTAFSGCTSMTSLTLPNGNLIIGTRAFFGCTGLKNVTINTTGSSINTRIGTEAFLSCTGLESLTVNVAVNCLSTIGTSAFKGCTALKTITMGGAGNMVIEDKVFDGCKSLLTVNIPACVSNIWTDSFWGCTGLTTITADSDSAKLSSKDGVLYTKDMKTLFIYPEGIVSKTFTVPTGVEKIAKSAFANRKNLEEVILPETVTFIDETAFSDCISLRSINLPSNLQTIALSAFNKCTSLLSIAVPASLTLMGTSAFANCTSLNNLTFGACSANIGDSAFYNCTALTTVNIPGEIDKIGASAFSGCSKIKDVTLNSGLVDIGNSAFTSCVLLNQITVPGTVAAIGAAAFAGCVSLASATLQAGVVRIGDNAFAGDKLLSNMNIPGSVENIGINSFANCSGLMNVTFAEGLQTIGTQAFSGCTSLTQIDIPSSVTSIGNYDNAFFNCTSLTDINVSTDNNNYSHIDGVLFNKAKTQLIFYPQGKTATSYTVPEVTTSIFDRAFKKCTKLQNVVITDGITSIGENAFESSGLISVSIPSTVSNIGASAFSDCIKLTSVTVPSGVTNVGRMAFLGCIGLTSLTIENGVTSIGESSFAGCTSLTSVVIPKSASIIGITAFSGCTKLTSVSIQKGVSNISTSAFRGCTGLVCVTIPDSVSEIGDYAFQNCTNLKYAFFFGSAPTTTNTPFVNTSGTFNIYFRPGASGFTSPLWKTYAANPSGIAGFIEHVYQECLGTGVLADELSSFVNRYLTKGLKGADVASEIVLSTAFAAKNYSDADFTAIMYKAFFNRTATAAETADMLSLLGSGVTRNYALASVVNAQGFKDYCATMDVIPGSIALPKITISFDSNGGSAITNITADYCSTFSAPAAPVRTGYAFAGWYTSTNYSKAWDFAVDKAKVNTVLYAKWDTATYTITFNAQGGSPVASTSAAYNTLISAPASPTREGYPFNGWYKDVNCTQAWNFGTDVVTANTTLYANWLSASVSYLTHVQDIGWQDSVADGAMSGTSGQSKRLEAIRISVANVSGGGIEYRTHVQDYGWMEWKADGALSGTSGQSKRLEAIEIRLTGAAADLYDVYYCVHAENKGWMGWAKNGESSGTAGYGYRLEAIMIVLVPKGGAAPGSTTNPYDVKPFVDTVLYKTHVQDIGWQGYVSNGEMSGTSAQSKRLEGIQIKIPNMAGGGIEYRTHVQDYGWMAWVANDVMSGTSGQSKRLEAIEIRLTGAAADKYDVYYCVHAQNFGWLDWAKNGQSAGTAAFGYRLEAIKIVLVLKGGPAPGSTGRPFVQG